MKLAILSDIHGNKLAFDRVLADLSTYNPEEVYFLGDAVNYYPDCNEVVGSLKRYNIRCIKGNHDFMVTENLHLSESAAMVYGLCNTQQLLSEQNFDFLGKLPTSIDIEIDSVKIHFVHGSPSNQLEGYLYPDTDLTDFKGLNYDFVFCGHTHRAMVRSAGNIQFANPGSAGMPRDIGDEASYILFDTERVNCQIHRVKLPVKDIIRTYKDYVHPSVIQLLGRK
ncbi:metallophosphoesterase family protein [Roseivirga thermotolerans]|uniref:metallophosphoesterase family protein n=1 Tax=Roseivirga thermotolerans TaxID=1758176 RepID=UPI00273CF5C9|nr:metallophosphoesterase family protein [Roseivirga thermotolerans]